MNIYAVMRGVNNPTLSWDSFGVCDDYYETISKMFLHKEKAEKFIKEISLPQNMFEVKENNKRVFVPNDAEKNEFGDYDEYVEYFIKEMEVIDNN